VTNCSIDDQNLTTTFQDCWRAHRLQELRGRDEELIERWLRWRDRKNDA